MVSACDDKDALLPRAWSWEFVVRQAVLQMPATTALVALGMDRNLQRQHCNTYAWCCCLLCDVHVLRLPDARGGCGGQRGVHGATRV
jgi:hypothetical protein